MNIIKNISFGIGSWAAITIGATLVHEYSHLSAIKLLFKNINPYISCDFRSSYCYTNWGGKAVIRDGLSITKKTGNGIVNAAGPIADITTAALLSTAAWKMRHSNRKTSLMLAANSVVHSMYTLHYCLSTLGMKYGDFAVVESDLGISHNIQAAIVGFVALGATAILTKLFFLKTPTEMNEKKNT